MTSSLDQHKTNLNEVWCESTPVVNKSFVTLTTICQPSMFLRLLPMSPLFLSSYVLPILFHNLALSSFLSPLFFFPVSGVMDINMLPVLQHLSGQWLQFLVDPIQWGHRGSLCHALSLLSSSSLWTSHAVCAIAIAGVRLATPGDWQCNGGSH